MQTDSILKLENSKKAFGGILAVNDVSLEVKSGEVFGLLGPNGSGKTTIFNCIAGHYLPNSGRITYKGTEITRLRPDQRSRMGVGRTFQITQPFEELTVEENVMAGSITHFNHLEDMRENAGSYIDIVGLSHKRTSPAKELSTGQRKRLELARALATQPKMLLLDEVTGGVDHASVPGLIALVEELRESGMTMMLIEHNMRVMTRLVDRMMFLNRGNKVAEGTADEIAAHPDVINLYLGSKNA